jgi:hypothetical protein
MSSSLLRVLVQAAFLCVLCVSSAYSASCAEFLIRATQPGRGERGDHAEKRREMKLNQYRTFCLVRGFLWWVLQNFAASRGSRFLIGKTV